MQLTTTRQGFAPATLTEAMEFSNMLAGSSMVPKGYQGRPQDIMVAMQWGAEIGLAPLQALQNISVINGKPSVYGDAAMALVQASPVCEGIEEMIEGEGTPNPTAVCIAHRKGRKPVVAKFSVEDAKRAGLWGKPGPWQAYPKRMLQMRARGFALRDAFPDVLKGLITVEEAQDFAVESKDITPAPANPLDALPSPPAGVAEALSPPPAVAPEAGDAQEPDEQWPVMLPGHDTPHQVVADHETWSLVYEDMADRLSRSTKYVERTRMTKLREFKEANQRVLDQLDPVKRLEHSSNYKRRLDRLGALLVGEKKTPDTQSGETPEEMAGAAANSTQE